jgi:hypothetical protein
MWLLSVDLLSVVNDVFDTKSHGCRRTKLKSCGSNGIRASPIEWLLGTCMKRTGSVLTWKRLISSWGEDGVCVHCRYTLAIESDRIYTRVSVAYSGRTILVVNNSSENVNRYRAITLAVAGGYPECQGEPARLPNDPVRATTEIKHFNQSTSLARTTKQSVRAKHLVS